MGYHDFRDDFKRRWKGPTHVHKVIAKING
jgi:hypothetical protein